MIKAHQGKIHSAEIKILIYKTLSKKVFVYSFYFLSNETILYKSFDNYTEMTNIF